MKKLVDIEYNTAQLCGLQTPLVFCKKKFKPKGAKSHLYVVVNNNHHHMIKMTQKFAGQKGNYILLFYMIYDQEENLLSFLQTGLAGLIAYTFSPAPAAAAAAAAPAGLISSFALSLLRTTFPS